MTEVCEWRDSIDNRRVANTIQSMRLLSYGVRIGAVQDRIEHTGTGGRGRTNHHGGYSGSVLVVTGVFLHRRLLQKMYAPA